MIAHGKHLKFVGWVEAISTVDGVWTQRVTQSNITDDILEIDWDLQDLPLPDGVGVNTYVSVHRTKAGEWYTVNLSKRMPRLTESRIKRADAHAKRLRRALGLDRDYPSEPTEG